VQPCFLFRQYCNCFPTFLKSYVCMHRHDHWNVHEQFYGKIQCLLFIILYTNTTVGASLPVNFLKKKFYGKIIFFHTLLPMHNHIFLLKFAEKDQLGTRSPERAFVSLCTPFEILHRGNNFLSLLSGSLFYGTPCMCS
jgi:hypothetical protein